jgi:glycosyltransferase involved in cell wall biosynthesis
VVDASDLGRVADRSIASHRGHLLILRLSCPLPEDALERLVRCAEAQTTATLVFPFSNWGGLAALPQLHAVNPLPRGLSASAMDALVQDLSPRRYPVLAGLAGPIVLIDRRALGLGEPIMAGTGNLAAPGLRSVRAQTEDYLCRLVARGARAVLCDDLFVYDHASLVGAAEAQAEEERELALVAGRHPEYQRQARVAGMVNPLRFFHLRLSEAIQRSERGHKLEVIQVLHNFGAPGGTELHTRQLVDGLVDEINSVVIYPQDLPPIVDAVTVCEERGPITIAVNQKLVAVERVFKGAPTNLRSPLIEACFARILAASAAEVVHFQHLQNLGSLLLPQLAQALGKRVVISLHDYFLLCPDWNLIGLSGKPCGRTHAIADEICTLCLGTKTDQLPNAAPLDLARYLAQRYSLVESALRLADRLVAPSQFVRDQFGAAFGASLADKIVVIGHGTDAHPINARHAPGTELRVAFVGNMTEAKGRRVFLQVVRRLQGRPIRFRLLGGYVPGPDLDGLPNLELGGSYWPEDLGNLLQSVDVALVTSITHESYCRTLDEILRAGTPVIASRVGALRERVRDGETGFLIEPDDVEALERAILALDRDRPLLAALRKNIAQLEFKSQQENVAEYLALYRALV